jgi:glycosyltransferase involved in cell wall biosynthesis
MWSVCVIARDEEETISRCLDSVPGSVARVVVVDDRTTDGTARWAARAGANVLTRRFDTFAGQRNAALAACSTDWVLFLDADEHLSDGARDELTAPRDPGLAGLSFPFRTRWLGRTLVGGRLGRDRKVRAVRRGRGRWVGTVHERLQLDGPVGALRHPIVHDPYRDWLEQVAAVDRYTAAQAAGLRPRRPGERGVRAAWHFVDALGLRGGWRDGLDGVLVAGVGAASVWTKWTRAGR